MQEDSLRGRQKRRYRVRTTGSVHSHPVVANRLAASPVPTKPNHSGPFAPRDIPVASRFVRYVRKDHAEADASAKRIVEQERARSPTERFELQAEARSWLQRGKSTIAGKAALLAELKANPKLCAAVTKVLERDGVRANPTEQELKSLPVRDGARARAVIGVTGALPEDQRIAALRRLRDNGVVMRKVLKQIAAAGAGN
jgi:hypothetical protein